MTLRSFKLIIYVNWTFLQPPSAIFREQKALVATSPTWSQHFFINRGAFYSILRNAMNDCSLLYLLNNNGWISSPLDSYRKCHCIQVCLKLHSRCTTISFGQSIEHYFETEWTLTTLAACCTKFNFENAEIYHKSSYVSEWARRGPSWETEKY